MPDSVDLHSPLLTRPEAVRIATQRDEAALYDLLMALNADNGFGIPISPEKIRAQMEKGTRQQGGIVGVIDGPDGQLVASIGLFMQQFWYAERYYLGEMWLFVRPEFRRGTRHADDLFRFAEWCRREMESGSDQPWIVMTSVSSPRRLDAKLRFWARHAEQVGGIFVMGN